MNDRVELWIKVDLFAELLGKSCNVKEKVEVFITIFHQGIYRFTWQFIGGKTQMGPQLCCVNGRRNTCSG